MSCFFSRKEMASSKFNNNTNNITLRIVGYIKGYIVFNP